MHVWLTLAASLVQKWGWEIMPDGAIVLAFTPVLERDKSAPKRDPMSVLSTFSTARGSKAKEATGKEATRPERERTTRGVRATVNSQQQYALKSKLKKEAEKATIGEICGIWRIKPMASKVCVVEMVEQECVGGSNYALSGNFMADVGVVDSLRTLEYLHDKYERAGKEADAEVMEYHVNQSHPKRGQLGEEQAGIVERCLALDGDFSLLEGNTGTVKVAMTENNARANTVRRGKGGIRNTLLRGAGKHLTHTHTHTSPLSLLTRCAPLFQAVLRVLLHQVVLLRSAPSSRSLLEEDRTQANGKIWSPLPLSSRCGAKSTRTKMA